MNNVAIVAILLALLQVQARHFENISVDTPDVILENILDGKICSRQIGVAEGDFEMTNGLVPEDNELLNMFYGCVYTRKGIMDKDGNVDEEALRGYLTNLFTLNQAISPSQKRLVNQSLNECRNVQGKDRNQKIVKVMNCVMKQLHSVIKE